MLTFKEYTTMGTADLPKLPRLQKLAKLPKMNRPVNRDEAQNNSSPRIQKMGTGEAVVQLKRMIAELSIMVRRLSQE
jgi:hypothetical protein